MANALGTSRAAPLVPRRAPEDVRPPCGRSRPPADVADATLAVLEHVAVELPRAERGRTAAELSTVLDTSTSLIQRARSEGIRRQRIRRSGSGRHLRYILRS